MVSVLLYSLTEYFAVTIQFFDVYFVDSFVRVIILTESPYVNYTAKNAQPVQG